MQKAYNVKFDDYKHYSVLATKRSRTQNLFITFAVWLVIGLVYVLATRLIDWLTPLHFLFLAVGAGFMLLFQVYYTWSTYNKMFSSQGQVLGDFQFSADSDGLRIISDQMTISMAWSFFQDVTLDEKTLIFWNATGEGIFIPMNAFDDEREVDELISLSGLQIAG